MTYSNSLDNSSKAECKREAYLLERVQLNHVRLGILTRIGLDIVTSHQTHSGG